MWHQVNSAIFSIDRFLALWRMQVTTQYILQCWKAAGKTPDMVEDEIPLFLCDEMRGKLTDEQRAFAKERQAEMYDHCQHAVLELFLFLSMLSQGLVGDLRSFCALRFPSGETAEPCPQALAFQSLCERTFQPRRPRTRCGAFRAVLGRIWGTRERGRIKAGVASGSSGRSLRPAVRVVTGLCGVSKMGSKTGSGDHVCGHNPRTPTAITKKQGSYPGKEKFMGKKERFAFYLTPEKKAILERRYREDGSRSMTAFIERAVDFYLDYLSANDAGLFLPTSIKSYLDGRLGQLEDRLSSIAFRQAVEQDMVAGILADVYQFSDEDLRRRRAESVQNVKKTNGRVSLEQRVRGAWEEDDEWQD